MKQKIVVRIPEDIKNKLKKHSEKSGVSMSGVICLALNAYISDDQEDKKEKSAIHQCTDIKCMRIYNAQAFSSCPKCGNTQYNIK